MQHEAAMAKKAARVEKARWKAQRKKERLPLLLWMRAEARHYRVHPVYPEWRDDLVERDPTPESERRSIIFLSEEIPLGWGFYQIDI
jgi:hypothetical protein